VKRLASTLRQTAAVARLGLLTVPQRLGSSAATVLGVAGVVAVFVGVLSIGEGFRKTLESTGGPENVVVLRGGTDTEMNSVVRRASTIVIGDAPGLARDARGQALASAELFVIVDLPKKSTGTPANVPLRGVSAQSFDVRGNVRLVEGRRFEPGSNELIAGRAAASQFGGLEVGNRLRWGENVWTVVGRFETGGTVAESELWCDAAVLAPAYRRGDTYQSVYARLAAPDRFAAFRTALTSDPRLDVAVLMESDYYASQSQALVAIVRVLGGLVTVLMGLGASFGAMNTMYTAIASRTREIATLRALGFSPAPVVVGVFLESLVLAGAGGVLGGALAWLAFDGYRAATLNWQSFSQVAFAFAVTPRLLVSGVLIGIAVGFLGALLPAWRAARLPVTAALREA
jgi:putative ABC transport system permease protein